MSDALHEANWRGIGKEALSDPSCGRPEVISAVVFGAELARILGARLTDRYRIGPDATNARRQFATATGATIDVDIPEATVVVAGEGYRCSVIMLPDRIAVSFDGNHGGEGILALYLLEWLHEQGELPTRGAHLSGGQLALLSDMRATLVDDETEPETCAD